VAFGAALRQMGGGLLRPRLRREDLHYAGKFERLELPLAVLSLLIVTLLLVHVIVTREKIHWRGEGTVSQNAEESSPGDLQFWLMSSNNYMLSDAKAGRLGNLPKPPPEVEKYARLAAAGGDEERDKFEEIVRIRDLLKQELFKLQREYGDNPDFDQPMSALEGSSLVLGVLKELGERAGRFSIRSLKATNQGGTARNPEHIAVTLSMTFFAEDSLVATDHYTAFYEAVQAEPWCAPFEPKSTTVLEGGGGIAVEGIRFDVDTTKAAVAAESEAQ
jgi:hypothetical protein